MKLPLYQIDAFTCGPFTGNPAAVVPLDAWLDDALLQSIALENNLSETAYLVREGDGWRVRWFTPNAEVELCGHATLASGFAVREFLDPGCDEVRFASRSGPLRVEADGERLALDFPADPPRAASTPDGLEAALGVPIEGYFQAGQPIALLESEARVRAVAPDMRWLEAHQPTLIVSARGADDADFVSRFFAPAFAVPEDPATGSAHCSLTPFWSARLGRRALFARQLSARGAELWCEDRGERVRIAGRAQLYLEGEIRIEGS